MRDDGRIECDLCPRHCRMADGQHGLCNIRQREGDQLLAAAYGRACGLAIDPIEKKPLYHYLPGSSVLSFGTTGCNLTCAFCQNYHLSRCEEIEGTRIGPEEIAKAAVQCGCESVAFTYNEPTVFFEYAIDTAKACHERGLKTVAVTNGWIEPEPRAEFFAHMDAANVDLKAFTDRFYKKLCGATLQPVLDTLVHIRHETDTWLECTTLLIPSWNDSPAEIDALTKWVVANLGPDIPWHFSAYRPTPQWDEAPPTPLEILLQAESIAKVNGIRNIHLGNVHLAT
ncbi:MAG: AmmeMemoRadiSam system radical SAM enzyme [Verrucomicrobiota bacterium]